ncbi:MAG TPA: hypothetical protein VGF60_11115 [Xanthobacteraceae bacterium]|jgi:hypothetical protein
MYRMLGLMIAISVAFASFSTRTPAQVAATETMLTEKQIEGFIAVQKALQGMALSDQASARYRAEQEGVIKKQGFKNFAEYEAVAASIFIVMENIDPQTKMFTDPHVAIRKEIEAVSIDKAIQNSEKKRLIKELNEALKSVQPVQFPSNIELVLKYYDKIDLITVAGNEAHSSANSSVVRTISE